MTNAELIADARQLIRHSSVSVPEHANMLGRLAAALEASDRRADQVEATAEHLHDEDTREIVALTQERDAALAVIEKVRAYAESIPRTRDRDVNPGLSNRSWLTAQDVLGILASAPADALREVKAEAWDEGATAASEGYDLPDAAQIHNPYREEQS